MQSYSSSDTTIAWKNSRFISSERSAALPMRMLTSLSGDDILLPRHVNWSTYFKGLQFNKKKKNVSIISVNGKIYFLLITFIQFLMNQLLRTVKMMT